MISSLKQKKKILPEIGPQADLNPRSSQCSTKLSHTLAYCTQ